MKTPRNIAIYISRNEHACLYETAEQYAFRHEDNFESREEIIASIESDQIWEVQWYPDTPVGHYRVMASTLDGALDYAIRVQEKDDHGKPA